MACPIVSDKDKSDHEFKRLERRFPAAFHLGESHAEKELQVCVLWRLEGYWDLAILGEGTQNLFFSIVLKVSVNWERDN